MSIETDCCIRTENHIFVINDDKTIWIQNKDGEGMGLTPEQLDEILFYVMDEYF